MVKYSKILFLSLFAAATCGLNLSPVLSQEEGVVFVSETSGEISSIDEGKSMFVVRHFKDDQYEDIAIYVDRATTIEKDYKSVDFAKIIVGDNAEVEYSTDDEGRNIATYIWIESEE